MSRYLGLDRINRRAYGSKHSQHVYAQASGWLDGGEKAAVEQVRPMAAGGAILDIGFGGGRMIPLLREISADYIGIDFTPELVSVARRRFPDADLRQMDARQLEFAPETFDFAMFSWNAIDTMDFDDQERVLREVHRALRAGGCFVFSSFNPEAPEEPPPTFRLNRASLRSFAGSVLRSARVAFRRYRFGHLNITSDDRAIRNISSHEYGVVATSVSVPARVRMLEQAGFVTELVFDHPAGNRIPADQTSQGSWCHYVARKQVPARSASR